MLNFKPSAIVEGFLYFYNMETEKIWNEYSDELLGFLITRTGDKDLAQDLLHETFIKVHLKLETLYDKANLRSWIYRICTNNLMDHYRKNAKAVSVENFSMDDAENTHSPEHCLLPLIEELPEIYKNALMLSEIKGLKQAKVAEILKISHTAAKSRIQRGKKLLQEGFMNCCDYTLNDKGMLTGEGKSEEECKVCN